MIRILLADDHAVVRRGLRRILTGEPNFEVCAEATNGEEAVALSGHHKPDVAILDIAMPKLSGIDAALQIRAIAPNCEIAIVTLHESEELRRSATAAGAHAYLLKTQVDRHLVPAVRALAKHRPYCSQGAKPSAAPSAF